MPNRTLIETALIVLAVSLPAKAQDGTGTLFGCATQPGTGDPMSHVTIELSASRSVYVTVFGDDQGCYEAAAPPGLYVLVAKMTGFPNVTRDELRVVPGGRLRVDFKMKFPAICECLSVKPPTVESLWAEADVVVRVRITGHDRQFEYDRDPRIVHTAAVLDLWKATDRAGQTSGTLQFSQHPGGPRYAVGDEFVLFLSARSTPPAIVAAFEIVDGRVQGQQFRFGLAFAPPVTAFLGKSSDDLVAEIVRLVGR